MENRTDRKWNQKFQAICENYELVLRNVIHVNTVYLLYFEYKNKMFIKTFNHQNVLRNGVTHHDVLSKKTTPYICMHAVHVFL